jgi:hypothetical protein
MPPKTIYFHERSKKSLCHSGFLHARFPGILLGKPLGSIQRGTEGMELHAHRRAAL